MFVPSSDLDQPLKVWPFHSGVPFASSARDSVVDSVALSWPLPKTQV